MKAPFPFSLLLSLSLLLQDRHAGIKPEFLIKVPNPFIPVTDRDPVPDRAVFLEPCERPGHQSRTDAT